MTSPPAPAAAHVRRPPASNRCRARRARRRSRSGAAARVHVVQESAHHTVDDQRVATGRDAVAVELRGTHRARVGRVVDQRNDGRGDPFADPAREQRTALQHRLAVECARQHPEHRARHERVEDHRDPPARRGFGPEHPARTRRGVTGDRVEIEVAERPARDEPVARLSARTVVGQGDRRRVTGGAAGVRLDPERVHERGFGERVAVARGLDIADARGRPPSSRAPGRA